MPDGHSHADIDELRKLGYETSDVVLTTLVKWLIFLFIFIGFASVVSLGIYKIFVPEGTEQVNGYPQAFERRIPAEPRLQVEPKEDLVRFRAVEEQELTTYGKPDSAVVEAKPDAVRIPIDKAMALIEKHGLPATPPAGSVNPAASTTPPQTTAPTQIQGSTTTTTSPGLPTSSPANGEPAGQQAAPPQVPRVGGTP